MGRWRVLVAAAVALGAAGCASHPAAVRADPGAVAAVRVAVAATLAAGSGRVEVRTTYRFENGETGPVQVADGEVDLARAAQRTTDDVGELRAVGGAGYQRVATEGTWRLLGSGVATTLGLAPLVLLPRLDAALVGVRRAPDEEVRGVPTRHFAAQLDLAALDPALPAGLGAARVPLELWVGPDDVVRRLQLVVPLHVVAQATVAGQSAPPPPLPSSFPPTTATSTQRTELFDLGAAVHVDVPERGPTGPLVGTGTATAVVPDAALLPDVVFPDPDAGSTLLPAPDLPAPDLPDPAPS